MRTQKAIGLNPFDNPAFVEGYDAWYETVGIRADRLEKSLLRWLLIRFSSPRTILEVGCGTGHFTRWFKEQGLQASGLDISALMLWKAGRRKRLPYVHGDALALPFSRAAFDVVALITTLEFVSDPVLALAEAKRVARHGLLLGVLNRQSLLGRQLKQEGGPVWETARLFNPTELVQEVRRVAGEAVTITWQTTLWPVWPGRLPLPWGGFVGMAVMWR